MLKNLNNQLINNILHIKKIFYKKYFAYKNFHIIYIIKKMYNKKGG